MPIEKTVTKRPLESLRGCENPWLKSTPQECLGAMAVICQTYDDGKSEYRLSRLHYAVGITIPLPKPLQAVEILCQSFSCSEEEVPSTD